MDSLKDTKGARCDAAPGSPDYGPISRRVCKRVGELEAEAARYRESVRLQGQLAAAAAILDEGHATKMSDPLAGSLAAYATALGWSTTEENLIPWLNLLPVLLLELGSSLGLLLARSVGERQGVQSVLSADETAASDDPPSGGAKGRVVEMLNENGGRVQSGQRGLAALIGVSAARVNQVLRELADDGIVTVTSLGQRGTLVELAKA